MRKITLVFKSFILLCFLLLISNCGTNEIEDNSNASVVNQVKNWYSLHKNELSSPILEYIDDLEWENAIISNGVDGVVIEVPITLQNQLQSSNEKATLFNDHHRLMFLKNDQNKFRAFYVQIFTDSKQANVDDNNFNYYNITENFDGKVILQDLSNGLNTLLQFKDGNKILPSQTAKMREEAITCVWIGWWKEDGFHPIQLLYCDAGGPAADDEIIPPYGGGGGGSTGNTTLPKPVQITDNLTGKAKCLNSLLTTQGNSFVEKLLSNFTGNSGFDIVINSKDVIYNKNNEEVNATTTESGIANFVEINISSSRIDARAALEGARIILHEYIHADMYRKLSSINKADVNASNFREVYEKYESNQHTTMANIYLSSMATALKDFHKNVLTDDYNKYVNAYGHPPSDEFYTALSWGGLQGDDVKAWTDLSKEEQDKIIKTASGVQEFTKPAPCK